MRRLVPFLAATALVLSTAAARADLGDELLKLLPDDGAAFDYFGWSVAIDGNTVIVGANQDNDNGKASGSAYLFDTATGQQIAKLLPNDGAALDLFGISVAISGRTAIVGSYADDDNGDYSGSAYLFDTATGRQIAKLLPSDGAAHDRFGESVGISGTTAIVGAHGDDDRGRGSGSAYLFDIATGQQYAKLLPKDGAVAGQFGRYVAIDGTTAIVGATGHDDNGILSGSAYLFDTVTGQQIAKLLPSDGAERDGFGRSVAISGAVAIVGASSNDDNGEDSGSAYVFARPEGGWADMTETAKLLPNDGAALDRFGFSVAISGATAIVGAIKDDDRSDDSGSAYLFDIATGQQIAKLLPNDAAVRDSCGWSVAISPDTAVVGSVSGSVYLFDAWTRPSYVDSSSGVGPSDWAVRLGRGFGQRGVEGWDRLNETKTKEQIRLGEKELVKLRQGISLDAQTRGPRFVEHVAHPLVGRICTFRLKIKYFMRALPPPDDPFEQGPLLLIAELPTWLKGKYTIDLIRPAGQSIRISPVGSGKTPKERKKEQREQEGERRTEFNKDVDDLQHELVVILPRGYQRPAERLGKFDISVAVVYVEWNTAAEMPTHIIHGIIIESEALGIDPSVVPGFPKPTAQSGPPGRKIRADSLAPKTGSSAGGDNVDTPTSENTSTPKGRISASELLNRIVDIKCVTKDPSEMTAKCGESSILIEATPNGAIEVVTFKISNAAPTPQQLRDQQFFVWTSLETMLSDWSGAGMTLGMQIPTLIQLSGLNQPVVIPFNEFLIRVQQVSETSFEIIVSKDRKYRDRNIRFFELGPD